MNIDTILDAIRPPANAAPVDDAADAEYSPNVFNIIEHGKIRPLPLEGLYRNAGAFLLCGGPSFNAMDSTPISRAGILTMGVNNAPKSYRPNLWTCMDTPERFLETIWRDPKIIKFCGMGKWRQPIWDHDAWKTSTTVVQECPGVVHIQRNTFFQASKWLDETSINWGNHKDHGGGRSVMLAAIKILYLLGVRRIYLLGVDFFMSPTYTYHFQEQRAKGAVKNNNSTYMRMVSFFTQLAPHFIEAGLKVYQCTPDSTLTVFPYLDYLKAVEMETSRMPDPATEKTYGMYVPGRGKEGAA